MSEKLDRLRKALEGVDVEAMLQPSTPDATLVDRLRNPPSVYSPVALRNEAADEIDRLRSAMREAWVEIERLRAALKPFSNAVYNDNGDVTITPASHHDYCRARKIFKEPS